MGGGGMFGGGLKCSHVKPHQDTYTHCKGLWKWVRQLKTITCYLDPKKNGDGLKFEVNLKMEPSKLKETNKVMVLLHDKQKGNSSSKNFVALLCLTAHQLLPWNFDPLSTGLSWTSGKHWIVKITHQVVFNHTLCGISMSKLSLHIPPRVCINISITN